MSKNVKEEKEEKEKKKQFKEYVLSVCEMPFPVRIKVNVYDNIIKDVLESSAKTFKVTVPNKKPMSVYVGLLKHVKRDKLEDKLRVHIIKGEVYIEKIE